MIGDQAARIVAALFDPSGAGYVECCQGLAESREAPDRTYHFGRLDMVGTLDSKTGDFAAAVLTTNNPSVLDSGFRAKWPNCYLIGIEYALQADAYRELGDHSRAKSDIATALFLTEQTVGRTVPIYAATELIYAHVLRATGAHAEAAQKEADVSARLDAMRHQQCNGCSISAAGFQ
jgi:hypothetical protein